jgi:uncharacterized membrane protein
MKRSVHTSPPNAKPARRENVDHRDGDRFPSAPKGYLTLGRRDITVAVLIALAMFAAAWYRHATYRSKTFDLGVFDQAIWLMTHGKAPISTLVGRNIFTDHFSPVLLAFVPLYWVAATPVWLLAAQAIAMGIGYLALQPLLDEVGVDRRWRLALSFAYVASTLLWDGTLSDFHTSTLSVPLILIGLTAALRDDGRALTPSAAGLLLIRDDLGLVVVSLALIGWGRSRHRTLRAWLLAASIGWVVMGQAIGIVAGSPYLWKLYYGRLGPSAGWILTHPWLSIPRAFRALWRIDVVQDVAAWLLPLAFLPLLRPGRLLVGSLWAAPILVASPLLGPGGLYLYHFGAVLFPFFLWTSAEAAIRLPSGIARRGPALIAGCTVVSFVALSPIQAWIVDRGDHPVAIERQAVALIRPADAVTASLGIGAHLAHREMFLPFPYPFAPQQRVPTSSEAVRVVSAAAATKIDAIALDVRDTTTGTLRRFLASPYLKGFTLMFDKDGVFVFRRTEP